jgi:hypothetical protein
MYAVDDDPDPDYHPGGRQRDDERGDRTAGSRSCSGTAATTSRRS